MGMIKAKSIEVEDVDEVFTTEQTIELEFIESTTAGIVTTLKKQWPKGLQKHLPLKKSRLFILWWSAVMQSVFGILRQRHPIVQEAFPNDLTNTQSQEEDSLVPTSIQDDDLIVNHIVNGLDISSPIADNVPNFELFPSD